MIDLADFDIIFQRVSQIRIVGKFIVTVCVTEQNGKREEEEKTFGRSRRKEWNYLVYQGEREQEMEEEEVLPMQWDSQNHPSEKFS